METSIRRVLPLMIALGAIAFALDAPASPATPDRRYVGSKSGAKIDGVFTSNVGAVVVDTTTAAGTTTNASFDVQPHHVGPTMLAWMSASLDNHATRKSVQIIRVDTATSTGVDSEILHEPFLQEITLPAFDGQSDDARTWTLRLSPVRSQGAGATGHVRWLTTSITNPWKAAYFRIEIAGVDSSRVSRIAPITVRVGAVPGRSDIPRAELVGEDFVRRGAAGPATSKSTISPLVVTMRSSGPELAGFQQWLAGDRAPRLGVLKMLTANMAETLCTVRLDGLVPTKITVDQVVQRANVEMSVGGIKLACP